MFDGCECFVYKQAHALALQRTRNLNTPQGEVGCNIDNVKFIVRPSRGSIYKQNTK